MGRPQRASCRFFLPAGMSLLTFIHERRYCHLFILSLTLIMSTISSPLCPLHFQPLSSPPFPSRDFQSLQTLSSSPIKIPFQTPLLEFEGKFFVKKFEDRRSKMMWLVSNLEGSRGGDWREWRQQWRLRWRR